MRFNRLILPCSLLLLAALGGCSWSKDRPKPVLNLQQGALDLSCLQRAAPDLHELFQGNLGGSEADQARAAGVWKCLDRALDVFSKYTEGVEKDAFRADELQRFANHFMKEDQKIDDSFRGSIFRLKTAVLGGTPERITRDEIQGLRRNLRQFGEAITALSPSLTVLLHPEKHALPKRQEARQAMNRFSNALAEIFGSSVHSLQWSELAGFASDLEKYIQADDPTALTLIHEQKDLLRNLKALLVGGSDSSIEPSKWKPILDGVSSTLGSYLMAGTPAEMIENLSFKFQSTPKEQARAIQSLGKELRRLKSSPGLKTGALIDRLADYYIKGRLLLEVALPQDKSPLSLNLLLEDKELRQAEARFIKNLLPSGGTPSPNLEPVRWIEPVRELLRELDQTLHEQTGKHASFSLLRLQKTCSENLDLFVDRRLGNQILAGIPLFLTFHSIMNHKSGDEIFISDLDPILEKAGQFLEKPFQQDVPMRENLERILSLLRRKPGIPAIEKSSLTETLPRLAPMLSEILKTRISSNDLAQVLDLVFRAKSLLWGTSPERLSIADLEEIGHVLDASVPFRNEPASALESLHKRWKRREFEPSISLEDLERVSGSPLAAMEPLTPLLQLAEHSRSLRILRRFILGTDSNLIRLDELVEMLKYAERTGKAARSVNTRELALILDELLRKPGSLNLSMTELGQVLASVQKLKPGTLGRIPLALPAALRLKHQWFGTPEDLLVRDDFVYLRQLLLLKEGGAQALVGFFALLKKNHSLETSALDLPSLRSLILSLQEPGPAGSLASAPDTPAAVALIDEAIRLKKILFADPEPVLRSKDLKRWIDQWLLLEKKAPLAKARGLLALLLEITAPQDLPRDSVVELITRVSGWMEKTGGKPLSIAGIQRQMEGVLNLKSVVLGTSPNTVTRKELELIRALLDVHLGKGPPAKKAAAYGKLLTPFIQRPIRLSDLAKALTPVINEFNLSGSLPIRPTLTNLKRIKLLTVGGSPDTLTPAELIALIQKTATATSAGDWIQKPAFELNSESFLWLESALALAIETGQSMGLREAYRKVEETFEGSGRSLKLPMDKSLFGIWYHVLEGRKGLLPFQMYTSHFELNDDCRITSEHLKLIKERVHSIGVRLKDLEQAYADSRAQPVNRGPLLLRLKHPGNAELVRNSVPTLRVIQGRKALRLEEMVEAGGEFILEELSYKAVLTEVVSFLFNRYNTRDSSPRLNVNEFALLLEDLRAPMINFGILYKSGPSAIVAEKQMKTINLMTRSGNGNDWLEVEETVDFMTLGYGTSNSFDRLIRHLSGTCRALMVSGIPGFEGKCVIQNLFKSDVFEKIYGDSIPGTTKLYSNLTGSRKTLFEVSTLKLTGKNLLQEKSRSIFDIFNERTLEDYSYVDFDYDMLQSISSVHPLLESVFQMMDYNNNQSVELAEALAYFPRFCPAIHAAAKGRVDGDCSSDAKAKDLKKLYGYLLVFKEKPGAGFLFWGSSWKKIQAGKIPFQALNRYELIRILSNLAP